MWPRLWLGWALAGAGLEVAALRGERHPKDTLCQNLQAVLMVRRPVARRLTLGGFLVFVAWFVRHIWG